MCSVSLPSTRATFRGTAVSGLRYRIERILKERRTDMHLRCGFDLDGKSCFISLACSAPNLAVFVAPSFQCVFIYLFMYICMYMGVFAIPSSKLILGIRL